MDSGVQKTISAFMNYEGNWERAGDTIYLLFVKPSFLFFLTLRVGMCFFLLGNYYCSSVEVERQTRYDANWQLVTSSGICTCHFNYLSCALQSRVICRSLAKLRTFCWNQLYRTVAGAVHIYWWDLHQLYWKVNALKAPVKIKYQKMENNK